MIQQGVQSSVRCPCDCELRSWKLDGGVLALQVEVQPLIAEPSGATVGAVLGEGVRRRGWYGTVRIATCYAPDRGRCQRSRPSKVSGSMAMAIFRYTLVAV